jgi:Second Messenger Oligonucleotide or Dinucleotide Synthetase domain
MAVSPAPYFTEDFTVGLNELLNLICEDLQISETRYGLAEDRYKAIARYLEANGSPFNTYKPEIFPQGSMRLNTTVKPLDGPHDLDFVLQLSVHYKVYNDSMKLIDTLYNYMCSSEVYRPMTTKLNRCARVEYKDDFYLDILPACCNPDLPGTCLMVPDREMKGWKDSNPKGYADWFDSRCAVMPAEYYAPVMARAEPIPEQQSVRDKTPLQLAVQLLKRWRDVRYAKRPELGPISIVLTTLAGDYYAGQRSVSETLDSVLRRMVLEIDKADSQGTRLLVLNPSNPKEDLSERWDDYPERYIAFKEGIREFQRQWAAILAKKGNVHSELEALFGEPLKKAVTKQTRRFQNDRQNNGLGITGAGLIVPASSGVRSIPQNTFYGEEE